MTDFIEYIRDSLSKIMMQYPEIKSNPIVSINNKNIQLPNYIILFYFK